MEQAAIDIGGNNDMGSNNGSEAVSMEFVYSQTGRSRIDDYPTESLSDLWKHIKHCLQEYCISQKEPAGFSRIVAYHTHRLVNALQILPKFQSQMDHAKSDLCDEYPWQRQRFAFDETMMAELVTIPGNQPTPLHSYDGPAGIIYVLDGELAVKRYTEINSEISACSGISKLNYRKVSHYRSSQGTLIDSISAPVVEMQANTERCIFLNIHLIDLPEHPHYFYYPSYISSENKQFFTRRVACEW